MEPGSLELTTLFIEIKLATIGLASLEPGSLVLTSPGLITLVLTSRIVSLFIGFEVATLEPTSPGLASLEPGSLGLVTGVVSVFIGFEVASLESASLVLTSLDPGSLGLVTLELALFSVELIPDSPVLTSLVTGFEPFLAFIFESSIMAFIFESSILKNSMVDFDSSLEPSLHTSKMIREIIIYLVSHILL